MKKVLSLFMSLVMLCTLTAGIDFSAYAGGWVDYAKSIEFNTIYTESASKNDFHIQINPGLRYYCDAFKFTVPVDGMVTLDLQAEDKDYIFYDRGYGTPGTACYIYNANNPDEIIWKTINSSAIARETSSALGFSYAKYEISLSAGTYYLQSQYYYNSNWGFEEEGTYDFWLSYQPSLSTPSNLRVVSRGQSSLALSWSGVGNANGYVLQKYSGGEWSDIAYPAGTSYTVVGLGAGSTNKFRVCAYINVNGINYYSSFRYLTACTKPKTASLKSLKTYKKGHKIKVYWNKVGGSASGYQIYWAKDKKFKKVVAKKTVSGRSTTSYTGKNFTKGKKYYVKVRAYKTVDGKKYYGSWSKVKSIRAK